MRVLVAGGTGFIGTELCEALAEAGHEVTALSRSPHDGGLPTGVASISADVTDPDDLAGPLSDHHAVVNLVALSPLFKQPRSDAHDRVHRQGTEHLLAAAREAEVERFVQMSALGADPEGTTAYLRAKGRAEAALRGSDLASTIVRPSVVFGEGGEFLRFARWVSFPPFTDRLLWPHVTPLPGAKSRFQPIWVGDLRELLVEAVTGEGHDGETYELGGPEVYTLAKIVRLLHRSEGKPARLLPVPNAMAKVGLGVGGAVPGFPLGADQGRSLDLDNVPESNDVTALGRPIAELRRLPEFLGLE